MFIYIVLKPKVTKSEYIRKFSTPIHLRLVPPRLSFSIPAMPRYNSISQARKLHVYFKGE